MKAKKLILSICFFIIILPFVISMLYSIPGADDFSMTYDLGNEFFFITALKKATNMYFRWSGLWIYMFIEYLCNPVMIFGPTSQMYGVVMILLFGGFLGILYYLISTIFKDIFQIKDNIKIWGFFVFFLSCFLNTDIYTEIFYWFIGSVYMWAVSLCMLTVALEIKFFSSGYKPKYAVLLSIIGFIACSFFQAAVFPGMAYLVIWLYYCRKEKKVLWKQLIPLTIMIIGGLISVLAPGNYVRHNSYDESGLHFSEAIYQAFFNECFVLFELLCKPFIWILVLGFGWVGFINYKNIKYRLNPFWCAVIIGITILLTCYPLALGISGIGLPNRYYFLLNIYICVMVMTWSVYVGAWIKREFNEKLIKQKKKIKFFLHFVIIIVAIWGICSVPTTPYFKTTVGMEEIKECHDSWMNIYLVIKTSQDSDVVLYVQPELLENDIIKIPNISYDIRYWENKDLSNYFGKNSIMLIVSSVWQDS